MVHLWGRNPVVTGWEVSRDETFRSHPVFCQTLVQHSSGFCPNLLLLGGGEFPPFGTCSLKTKLPTYGAQAQALPCPPVSEIQVHSNLMFSGNMRDDKKTE